MIRQKKSHTWTFKPLLWHPYCQKSYLFIDLLNWFRWCDNGNYGKLSRLLRLPWFKPGQCRKYIDENAAFIATALPCHLLLLFCCLAFISSVHPLRPHSACSESSYYSPDISQWKAWNCSELSRSFSLTWREMLRIGWTVCHTDSSVSSSFGF